MKRILLFGLVMLLAGVAFGQNKRVRGNFVGSKYAGKSVFIDTLGYTVVDSSAADIIQIDSVFQGAMLQYDTTAGWEAANRAAVLGYKEYVALLTQSGTDAPVATVLYNDLGGAVVWTYSSVGEYIGILVGAFTANKTDPGDYSVPIGEDPTGLENGLSIFLAKTGTDAVILTAIDSSDLPANGFTGVVVKIRVYN